jgi:hypothetical protein
VIYWIVNCMDKWMLMNLDCIWNFDEDMY